MSESLQKFLENPVFIEQKPFVLEKIVRQFAEKSNSAETRRTYTAYLKEFFSFVNPTTGEQALRVNSEDVIVWREALKAQGRKPIPSALNSPPSARFTSISNISVLFSIIRLPFFSSRRRKSAMIRKGALWLRSRCDCFWNCRKRRPSSERVITH